MFLSKSEFSKVIINSPLISIDLCILKDKKLLLGKRINPPAKNSYFVPGGRIRKSEKIKDAFMRILKDELGFELKENNYKFIKELGIFEHFYEDNFLNNEEFTTHYIVIAYLVHYKSLIKKYKKILNNQHSDYIWVDINCRKNNVNNIHNNCLVYLNILGVNEK